MCSILSSSSFFLNIFTKLHIFHKHIFKVDKISPAHLQSFKSDTVLTVYYFVSRFRNLVNGILQTGVHTLRNTLWKVEYKFFKTCKGVNLNHCNVFSQNLLFSTDFTEIWPHRRKLVSHLVIDSVLSLFRFETPESQRSENYGGAEHSPKKKVSHLM